MAWSAWFEIERARTAIALCAVPELTSGLGIQPSKFVQWRGFRKMSKIKRPVIFPRRPGHQRSRQVILPLGGSFLKHERAQMPNYRVVTIDQAGKLGRNRAFVCDNDHDATIWAKQLVDEAPVELWSGARFITRLEPQSAFKSTTRL